MTQEFVAETIGVSRQAVSKWESGSSDPSTTNLMALAKLFVLHLKIFFEKQNSVKTKGENFFTKSLPFGSF
ncbi:MAG TPA: helix-turn-helix transcriptional regulator, partial [Firmicutes bacterium]|nr:helix-turn-helix transcriptional regulator [Bacillota bacterium]